MLLKMETYDFDTPVDRTGKETLKWGKYEGRDILPLWVADMDFLCPPPVIDALRAEIDHGLFGYSLPPRELVEILGKRLQTQYGWSIDPSWIIWLPGMVPGLNIASRCVGDPGDDILTTTPIYPPFLTAPGYAGRNALRYEMNFDHTLERWAIDFNALQQTITTKTNLFLFCNPHNPLGRIFSREELQETAEFCLQNNLIICSDEIHCDLLLEPNKPHIPIATLSPEIEDRTITLMAPSKTFNLPGFGCSFAIIPNAQLKAAFKKVCAGIVPDPAAIGYTAALAAYRDSAQWHRQLLDYLKSNADLAYQRISSMPGLWTHPVEATYLLWIDARKLGQDDPHRFFEDHGIGLSNGRDFGKPGFVRLNFGCTRSLLEQGLDRMETAVMGLDGMGQ
jgi:cystathionine beta-lyase